MLSLYHPDWPKDTTQGGVSLLISERRLTKALVAGIVKTVLDREVLHSHGMADPKRKPTMSDAIHE
jgi:hypothetical protein